MVANDPVAQSRYFHKYLMAILEHILQWDFELQMSKPGGGLFGIALGFAFCKEWQKRGSPHAHGLMQVLGMHDTDALRLYLFQHPDVFAAFVTFLQSVSCTCGHGAENPVDDFAADIACGNPMHGPECQQKGFDPSPIADADVPGMLAPDNGDAQDGDERAFNFCSLKSLPPDHPDADAVMRADIKYYGQHTAIHKCGDACLVKDKSGDMVCKRHYPRGPQSPWRIQVKPAIATLRETLPEEQREPLKGSDLELVEERIHPLSVPHNDLVSALVRCNNCTQILTTDSKAFEIYMSAYASKIGPSLVAQLQILHAAVAKVKNLEEDDAKKRTQRLLVTCVNSLSSLQEYTAEQVAGYFLGHPEFYCSHGDNFLPVLPAKYTSFVQRFFDQPDGKAVADHNQPEEDNGQDNVPVVAKDKEEADDDDDAEDAPVVAKNGEEDEPDEMHIERGADLLEIEVETNEAGEKQISTRDIADDYRFRGDLLEQCCLVQVLERYKVQRAKKDNARKNNAGRKPNERVPFHEDHPHSGKREHFRYDLPRILRFIGAAFPRNNATEPMYQDRYALWVLTFYKPWSGTHSLPLYS